MTHFKNEYSREKKLFSVPNDVHKSKLFILFVLERMLLFTCTFNILL